jgi:alpha-mannosidase
MQIFGQSHLDLAWQWPREETVRKSARTMSTQLALLEEYPEYKYLFCQAPLYLMLRENYPEIWERTRRFIDSGRVIVEGGMWLEPDTNLPSGESLIRQFVFGKRFYEEELGKETRVLWLPDSFGFSAALPQIMKSCGVDYFATKKLIDGYNDSDPFPYTTFMWQGLDGSRVLSHVYRKCNSPIDPQTFAKRWETDRIQKDGIKTYLFPFGYGDGGGGPTRAMLESARRLVDLEGSPRARMEGPREFFEEIEARGLPEDVYVGELYFTEHRGTYTSQARTKRANRKAEFALREAELWGALAAAEGALEYPRAAMDEAWKHLLFNQFHDIVTGTSIRRVHEEAEAELAEVASSAENVAEAARSSLSARSSLKASDPGSDAARTRLPTTKSMRIFNSLSWPRRELVALPRGFVGAFAADGSALDVQEVGLSKLVELDLPSCGWTTLYLADGGSGGAARAAAPPPTGAAPEPSGARASVEGGTCFLENGLIRVELDEKGALDSVFDKVSGRELAAGPCNEMRMYKDVTTNYDAWDIDSMYESLPVALPEPASLRVLASGPLVASVRVERRLASSDLVQEISLRRGSARLEFRTRIEWREDHKLLKVAFPLAVHAEEALHEIQFGYVRRPNHKTRKFDADRYESCHQRWVALAESRRGVAVLNDCKYGASVSGGCIALTLLKSAYVPDMKADRGSQEFVYALYPWNGSLAESGLVREGYGLNCPPAAEAVREGNLPGERSVFRVDDPAIVLETVKPAEDGSADLVLRLYESLGSATRCVIETDVPFERAQETDMLERGGRPIGAEQGAMSLDFRPFEIKTLRLSRLEAITP